MSNLPVPYDPEFAAWQQPMILLHPTPVQKSHFADDIWDRIVDPIFGRPIYFDRQGRPLSLMQWGELHETEYKRIAKDTIGDAEVSTVWLGIDHGFAHGDEDYRPVIFETMIFGGEYDNWQMRYCTEADAVKGHAEAVTDLRAGMRPWWAYGGEDDDEWHMKGER